VTVALPVTAGAISFRGRRVAASDGVPLLDDHFCVLRCPARHALTSLPLFIIAPSQPASRARGAAAQSPVRKLREIRTLRGRQPEAHLRNSPLEPAKRCSIRALWRARGYFPPLVCGARGCSRN